MADEYSDDYAKQRCKEIVNNGIVTEEDKLFLEELIKEHPHYVEKMGKGIKEFFIKKVWHQGKVMHILRTDGTITDFSYMKCVYPHISSRIGRIKLACRNAIVPTIKAFKKKEDTVVHHSKISFSRISDDWIKTQNINHLKTEVARIGRRKSMKFKDDKIAESFVEYHNKVAHLVELTKEEHHLLHEAYKGAERGDE